MEEDNRPNRLFKKKYLEGAKARATIITYI